MFKFLQGFFKLPERISDTYVVNEDGIIRETSNGLTKRINWSEVTKISILTTDQGPFFDDFFYVFQAESLVMMLPLGISVKIDLLTWLQKKFPDINPEAVIAASGSAQNAVFPLWEGPRTEVIGHQH